jgi:hypothetical protein
MDRWPISPPEPDIVGKCAHCDGELYEGCEYVYDNLDSEWYCDDDCFVKQRRDGGDITDKTIEAPEHDYDDC